MKRSRLPGWYWINERLCIKLTCRHWKFFQYGNGHITRWWQIGKVRLVYVKI